MKHALWMLACASLVSPSFAAPSASVLVGRPTRLAPSAQFVSLAVAQATNGAQLSNEAQSTHGAQATVLTQATAPAAQASDAADERTKELKRVLQFAGGGTLRAKSRWNIDHWEYRAGSEWAALAPGAVSAARLERELLSEARELRRASEASGIVGRVQLADWMLRAGLLEEACDEFDRVLELDPDQQDALRILHALPVPLRIPGSDAETLEDSIRIAATAPRCLQEAATSELNRRVESEPVLAALEHGLTSHSQRVRQFSALALRRIDAKASVRSLLSRAVLDGSDMVRREAAFALRDTNEPAVVVPLVRALGSSSNVVRENAIDALGNIGFAAALAPLASRLGALSAPQSAGGWRAPASNIFVGRQMAYVQDFDVEVAQFASVADPQVNTLIEGSVLDVRVIGVYETSVPLESRKLRTALHKITGAAPGDTNKAWLAWWEQNRSRYDPAGARPPRETTATAAARKPNAP
ncbi:MAG: HEAT repeat domain-containing protein [Planctomycetes bacterium]|nr:HEAT repeat domain-containing protein [Planctomycetota bacterium]